MIHYITAGELKLDNQTGMIEHGNQKVFLSDIERIVFAKLLLAHWGVCLREDLFHAVYRSAPKDRIDLQNYISPVITRLRRKVSHLVEIQPVKGRGYQMSRARKPV